MRDLAEMKLPLDSILEALAAGAADTSVCDWTVDGLLRREHLQRQDTLLVAAWPESLPGFVDAHLYRVPEDYRTRGRFAPSEIAHLAYMSVPSAVLDRFISPESELSAYVGREIPRRDL